MNDLSPDKDDLELNATAQRLLRTPTEADPLSPEQIDAGTPYIEVMGS